MDKVIVELAAKYCTGKKYVTVPDVLACIERESGGNPLFSGKEKQYRDNLWSAKQITKIPEDQLIEAMRIDKGVYAGKLSKFRVEPGYWEWAKTLTQFKPVEQALLASSFGVGQKMMRWLVANGVPQEKWIDLINHFMGDLPSQVMYCAGDLNSLLAGTKGDRPLAYTRYNAGPSAKTVTEYGTDVMKRYQKFSAQK